MRALLVLGLVLGCSKGKDTVPASTGSGSAATTSASDGSASPVADPVALPDVAGHGYTKQPPAPRVSATPTQIVVDGKQALALEAGAPPASAVENGQLPAVIDALSAANAAADGRMVLAFDKQLSYGLLYQLLLTLKTQGVRSYGILARQGSDTVMLPLDVPENAAAMFDEPQPGRRSPGADLGEQIKAGSSRAIGASVEVGETSVAPESSLTAAVVKRKVSAAYGHLVKRCVIDASKRDASPGGSIALTFTIDETGKTMEPRAGGVPKDIADCITRSMASWVFPIAKGATGQPIRVTASVAMIIAYHDAGPSPDVPAPLAPGAKTGSDAKSDGEMALPPGEPALGVVVSVSKDDVVLWSISGKEGTLADPRERIPLAGGKASAELATHLDAIIKKRWSGKRKRASRDLAIIFMADRTTSMQTVAELLGSVRAAPDGTELFPTVLLSPGFE